MIRRSWVLLSKVSSSTTATGSRRQRTVVRDPRKAKKVSARTVAAAQDQNQNLPVENNNNRQDQQQQLPSLPSLPFEPNTQNQQSVGSTLASYTLAGVGIAMGVTLVGALFRGL